MTLVDDEPAVVGPSPMALEAPLTREAVLRNAQRLVPLVASEADVVEADGRLSERLAIEMRRSGVFQMSFPARLGGLEMGLSDQVDVVALIAATDASAGWHVGVLNGTGYYASRLGDAAYAELYPTRDRPTAGSFHPRGHAVRVDDGYLVSGTWDWGSGADVADHIVGGCLVAERDGTPVPGRAGQMHLGLWLPKSSIRSAGNWQTIGLRGSGSASFSIDEPVFVPANHCFDREAGWDAAADRLNRTPLVAHFALGGVAIGLARRAVTLAGEALRARSSRDSAASQALGEVMADVDLAIAGVREVARRTDDLLFGNHPPEAFTAAHEARMTAANAASGAMLRRILPVCMELVGSYYIMDSHPMQKVIRDAVGALAHSGMRREHLAALANAALDDRAFGFTLLDDRDDWPRRIAGGI